MRIRTACPLLLLLACGLAAAEPVQAAHDQAAALAAEAFAELDRTMARLASDDQASRLAGQAQQRADAAALPPPAQPAPAAPPAAAGPTRVQADAPPTTTLTLATTSSGDPVQGLQAVIAGLGLSTGIQERNRQTLIIATGTAQVHGTPGTPAWIEARAAAYQTAALRARADLAAVLGEVVLSGRSVDLLEAPPLLDTGAPPPASRERIAAGARTLAQAQLDAELRKLGVAPEQYEALPPERRRELYAERYEQSVRTRATAALAGCATLAVTEGPWQGNQAICVGLVWSQNLARLAALGNRYGSQLPPKAPAPGTRILEQIPGDGAVLARRFGVQRCVDDSGDIVIVAYGQAGLPQTGAAMRAAALGSAFDKAALEAKAMLKDFLWQETDSEALRQFAQLAQATAGERSGDLQAVLTQQDRFQRTIRARAGELTLTGASELRRWTTRVDGSEAAGVVVAWSPRRQRIALGATGGAGSDVVGSPAAAPAGGAGTATFDPSW